MNKKEKIEILQLLFAGLLVDITNNFNKFGILEEIISQKEFENKLAAPARIQQFDLKNPVNVFNLYTELFGYVVWTSDKVKDGYRFTANSCKLCLIAKTISSVQPCGLCCISPLKVLLDFLPQAYKLKVENTLWNSNQCIFLTTINKQNRGTDLCII